MKRAPRPQLVLWERQSPVAGLQSWSLPHPSPYVEMSDLKTQEFKRWFEGTESHLLATLRTAYVFKRVRIIM